MEAGKQPYLEFGQLLERAAVRAGLSHKEIAALVGVDERSVRRYVNGERMPKPDVLDAWEQACGLQEGALKGFATRPAAGFTGRRVPGWRALALSAAAVLLLVLGGLGGWRLTHPSLSARFTSPAEGELVDYPTKDITGIAAHASGRELWLVERVVDERLVHPFQKACTLAAGRWSCGVGYLGRRSDHGRQFTLELVEPDETAREIFREYGRRDTKAAGAYRGIPMPAGVHRLALISVTRR